MTWHFVAPVWGTAYVDKFLTYCVPTLLAPRNLPWLAHRSMCRFKLYTRAEDVPALKAALAFQELGAVLPVDLILIETLGAELALFEELFQGTHKFATMSACHWHAIHAAWAEEATLSFLSPDVVYSDGTFAHLETLVNEGWRAALITGLHTTGATFGQAFLRRFPRGGRGGISAPARPLVALALANLHPFAEELCIGPEGASTFSQMYWKVAQEGLLVRAWHLMPIMIRPLRPPQKPFWSTDVDYVAQVLDDPESVRLVDDSDDGFLAELLPAEADRVVRQRQIPFNMLHYAIDAREMFLMASHWGRGAFSLAFVERTLRFHGGPLSAAWDPPQADSDCFVASMLEWIRFLERRPSALREMSLLAQGPPGQDLAYYLQSAYSFEVKAGLEALGAGHCAEAEAAFKSAAALRPDRYKPLINLGRCHLAQDRPQEAWDCLQAALQLDPANPEAMEVAERVAARLKGPA